ncbi:DUF3084 domain-containing protein [Halarsenatibacter silvermanii]|uniref:DUF3084 domain-containing protein n=1 Tax=Halarsenatibacter silvermanii TaxID=321763 RepID=A0A1G9HRS0_9FIRM|nr:DUF3084 domain-containing protein [Halarsenatibacter silvermanii]SDL15707.1 Protein of unknown function [Halarsenatibacter silvermanii]
MYAFVLVIMLILLSGMIAYIGDQLGMKIGKKRISIFGLRPRYSSIIITVVTGMVIATLSVVILLSVYSGLRQALFNINEVMERLEQLDTELERRTAEVEEMEEQRDELQGRLDELRDERDELQVMVDDLSGERYELENRIEELNEELAAVSEELDEARDQLAYFRDEDIVFRRGEIIYSAVIEGGRSEDEIIADINDFLAQANAAASERPIELDDDTGMALHLQTEDILHAAQLLYNLERGERMIISLAARVNVPRHDKLRADLHLNRNFVVYDEGESIADRTIDADSSTSEIDDELRELLAEVNYHASQEGILQNIDGTVGSLDFVNFYQLVSDIQEYEGEVSVKVEASEEIWRSDRLSDNITFSIEAASGEEEAARIEFSGDEEDV